MEDGTLNGSTVQQFLEREPQAWRYPDVEEDLRSIRSGSGGAVGVSNGGGTDGGGTRAQDGGGRSGVDLEVADELVQRDAVLEPIEYLPHGQARSPETGNSAHARGIEPDRFLKRHGPILSALGERLHGCACAVRDIAFGRIRLETGLSNQWSG